MRAMKEQVGNAVSLIENLELTHPVRVGIDGFCGAGKSTFSDLLKSRLSSSNRQIIQATTDDFQHPPNIRWQKGPESPEGFYRDAIDERALIDELLSPLGPAGSGMYRTSVFDIHSRRPNPSTQKHADRAAILLLDGLFLHNDSLIEYFDLTVFVDAPYETCLERAKLRDRERKSDVNEIERLYRRRYIPGFNMYFAEVEPVSKASLIVSNG